MRTSGSHLETKGSQKAKLTSAVTLGIEPTKYNEDVTERLGEKITEMVVSQLESGPDARKLFEEGKVHQEIRAIGSAETRGIRDDTTVM